MCKNIRISGKLDDGRFVRLQLNKYRTNTCANLALVAHKSRRVANDWFIQRNSPADSVTTGSGLSVFTWALNAVVENLDWIKSNKIAVIVIDSRCGDRRLSAYRKLLKRYKIKVEHAFSANDGREFIAIRI